MSKFSTKLAPRGSFCLGIAVGLLLAGFFLKDGILLTLGISALTLLTSCYFLGRANLANLDISLSLPSRLHANKRYRPNLSITNNRSILDAFMVKLYIALPHSSILASETNWIPAGSGAYSTIPVRIPMRSSELTHPFKFTSFFPLSLFYFTRHQLLQQPITIYPRAITPTEILNDGLLGQRNIPRLNNTTTDHGDPRGIRPSQPGDSAKNIHWQASARSMARGHGILIREYDPPGQFPTRCNIVFHSYSSIRQMMREDSFELAISLLVGTVNYLRNLNIQFKLLADFIAWNPYSAKTRPQYYELLAILADASRAVATEKHELLETLNSLPSDQPTIIISDMEPDSWQNEIKTKAHTNHIIIDIRQIHFPYRKTISAKEALAKSSQ